VNEKKFKSVTVSKIYEIENEENFIENNKYNEDLNKGDIKLDVITALNLLKETVIEDCNKISKDYDNNIKVIFRLKTIFFRKENEK